MNHSNRPALIVHGGAGDIPEEEHETYLNGCRIAAQTAWQLLEAGATALHAVEVAARILEDDPTYDSGYGSVLNQRGEVEMDAIIMDGKTLEMGAVICVQNIANPITLARLVMTETPHNILAGIGAQEFAISQKIPLSPMESLISAGARRHYEAKKHGTQLQGEPQGTIGAVARDIHGNVAAATSTGGTNYKMVGRVGDTPLVGSGAYADNRSGAVSATGHGEDIMRVCLSKTAADAIAHGMDAQQAADFAVRYMVERVGGLGGLIIVDKDGNIGFAHSTPHISVAWVDQAAAAPGQSADSMGEAVIRAALQR